MTRIGIWAPRSATKSKRAAADQRIEAPGAELADLRLQRVHLLRREHPRQQAAVDRVDRRVLEDDDARRHLDVGLDQLEDRAPSRDVGLPVDEAALDVVEPAHARRSRTCRCSRAAPPPAAGGTPDTDRRRSRRRRGRRRCQRQPGPRAETSRSASRRALSAGWRSTSCSPRPRRAASGSASNLGCELLPRRFALGREVLGRPVALVGAVALEHVAGDGGLVHLVDAVGDAHGGRRGVHGLDRREVGGAERAEDVQGVERHLAQHLGHRVLHRGDVGAGLLGAACCRSSRPSRARTGAACGSAA